MRLTKLKRIAASLMLCSLLMTFGIVNASAFESSVVYEGDAKKVVILPDDDMFQNFKGLMPGSTGDQAIQLRNNGGETIRVYMYAESVEESAFENHTQYVINQELLSEMSIQVRLTANGNAPVLLYDGPLSGKPAEDGSTTGDLTKDILLATMMANTQAQIDVKLQVPETLDNRYQNALAKVRWVFYVEGRDRPVVSIPEESTPLNPPSSTPSRPVVSIPEESTPLNPPSRPVIDIPEESTPLNDPTLVQTGDNADYTIVIVILVAAIVLVVVMLILKKRADTHKKD